MDADTKRKFQLALIAVFIVAGARTLWIFHERNATSVPEKPAPKERNVDDYVYLRPSHAHDLESARAAIKGKTVWMRAGNAVAYSYFFFPNHVIECKVTTPNTVCILPSLAQLDVKDVVLKGSDMFAVFNFLPPTPAHPGAPSASIPSKPASEYLYAAPIGVVTNGDATVLIDDIFFLEDPHKLYNHWTKDQWAAVERHEITAGMSET